MSTNYLTLYESFKIFRDAMLQNQEFDLIARRRDTDALWLGVSGHAL